MKQVVQARCPGCRNVLRVPADWIGQSIRCKHCGQIIQAKKKSLDGTRAEAAGEGPAATPRTAAAAAPQAGAAATAAPAVSPIAAEPAPPPERMPAAAGDQPFGQLDDGGGITLPRYRRKKKGSGWIIGLVAAGILVVAAAGGAFIMIKMRGPVSAGPPEGKAVKESGPSHKTLVDDLPKPTKGFPRRLLAVSVNNYLYANPISYGEGEKSVAGVMKRLATALHIPDSQVAELSDGASPANTPVKSVIQTTITDYLDSSRPEDRIILLFIGHAVAVGDEAFLVPIEGELTVKETLIPLAWLYDKLAKCKARQKVLILDVCRFDPSRGLERPGSGPMADKLDEALQKPPAGVQVWSACTAGQYSYENYSYIHSGIFLSALWDGVGPFDKARVELGIQKPEDSLPVAVLANGTEGRMGVDKGTENEANDSFTMKQTPRLVGQEAADGAPYDPQEPLPEKLVLKPEAPPPGGATPPTLVASILKDTGALVTREGSAALRVDTLPLFDAKVMAKYPAKDPTPALKDAITHAVTLLEENSQSFQESFVGQADNAAIKKQIADKQREPAKALARFQDVEEEMDKAAEDVESEPRLWQAIYAYVRSRVEARHAYVYEYDFMLGQIRKDSLPPRDPLKSSGWRLAAQDKLQSGTEAKTHALASKKLLQTMLKKYHDTPFEVLAKRESFTSLGLQWQVIPQTPVGGDT